VKDLALAEEAAGKAVEAQPDNPFCRAALGELYLLRGKAMFAVTNLAAAVAAIDRLEGRKQALVDKARLFLCMALTESEQWEAAAQTCTARDDMAVEFLPAYSYYGGIAAFRAGREKKAAIYLDSPLMVAMEGRYQDSAAEFRRLAFARLIGGAPGFKLATSMAFGYDSNALMAPDDPTSVSLPDNVDSGRGTVSLSLGYVTRELGRHQLNVSANLFRSFHTNELANALNATDVSASVGGVTWFPTSRGKASMGLRYAYRTLLLDGRDYDEDVHVTREDELFAFLQSHSISLGPTWWVGGRGSSFTLRYAFASQRYNELVRNAMVHSLAIGQEIVPADALSITLGESVLIAQSSEAYRRYGVALGLTIAWRPHRIITLVARGNVQVEHYYDSAAYFGVGEERLDWPFFGQGEVHFNLKEGFSVAIYGGGSGRHSSIEALSYSKWEVGTMLNWSLGGAQ
jgi:hypothetical protein